MSTAEEPAFRSADLKTQAELTRHREAMPALTGLRFFAAGYVVVFHSHLAQWLSEHHCLAASTFFNNGGFAVLLFFLLSGFILSYTYTAQIQSSGQVRRFWEARFSRIWPLYVFSLLVSTVTDHSTPNFLVAIATLCMVQAWNPFSLGMAGAWNFVCWTLSAEAFFYLLFPILQRALEKLSIRSLVAILMVLVTIAILARTGSHGFGSLSTGIFRWLPLAIVRTPDFAIGVCLGNLFLRFSAICGAQRSYNHTAQWLTWTGAFSSIVLLSHADQRWTAFTVAGFLLFLAGLITERTIIRTLLASRVIVIGGQISYAMYLLQWPCKSIMNAACDSIGVDSPNLRFLLYLICLLSISAAGFYGIESPARNALREMFLKIETRRKLSRMNA